MSTMEDASQERQLSSSQSGSGRSCLSSGSCLIFCSAALASVGGLLFGYDIGIVSGAMLQLRQSFQINCLMQEIVVCSLLMGAFLASLFGGSIVDSFGRKMGILVSSLLFIGGALFLAFSTSVSMLLFGRFVVGFGVSLSVTTDCAYISEISPPNARGMLVTLNELGITIGFLLAYILNYAFIDVDDGWRYMFGLSAVPASVLLVALVFLPKSPYYLVLKGRPEKAKEVLLRIRPSSNADEMVKEMAAALNEEKSTELKSLFSKTDNMRWRMTIGMLLVLFQQFSGNANILFYAPTIFSQIGFCSNAASTLASVGLGLIKVFSAVFSMLLLDKFGRRLFLLAGSAIMTVSLMTLGVELILTSGTIHGVCQDNQPTINNNTYGNSSDHCPVEGEMEGNMQKTISVVTLMCFAFAYEFSFGVGSWLVLSEIFPTTVRGRCISIATGVNWLANVVVSMTFLELFYAIGVGQTFVLYACICALSFVFILVCIPETKGKTLEQISQEFNSKAQLEMPSFCKYLLCCRRYHLSPSELIPIRERNGAQPLANGL